MNKLFAYALLSATAITLIGSGIVYAQGPQSWFWAQEIAEDSIVKHQEILEHKAQIMGISTEEMQENWQENKRFGKFAEDYGLDREEIMEKMAEARRNNLQERLKALIESGVISQEQADQRMEAMQDESFGGIRAHRGFNKPFRQGLGCGKEL